MGRKFALIGAAGFVAEKHLKAIRAVGGDLIAALDPHDSVGVLDRYFQDCLFFAEFERFDRFLSEHPVDYVTICSPNYLHDAHCRFAMRIGSDAICEKPLVLSVRNLEGLKRHEIKTGKRVWNILQCRLHPEAIRMAGNMDRTIAIHDVDIAYSTPRGPWYQYSWKGSLTRSGGIETNIGIHLFDLCSWFFGELVDFSVIKTSNEFSCGRVFMECGEVKWSLSILNEVEKSRSFIVDGEAYNFLDGFDDLHSESYRKIMKGEGFGIMDAAGGINICEKLRYASTFGREVFNR